MYNTCTTHCGIPGAWLALDGRSLGIGIGWIGTGLEGSRVPICYLGHLLAEVWRKAHLLFQGAFSHCGGSFVLQLDANEIAHGLHT